MIAHQKIIKDKKAVTDKNNLFGAYWEKINKSLTGAIVKEIDRKTAGTIIKEYEWLGCMPAIVLYCFGIFFDDYCGGVVVFSPEYSENLGVWDKYGFTNKMILISRGACIHWTPKNTASKLIMAAIKLLPEKYKVITCTVDRLAGEIGTIYQSCNFYYVGSMRESNPNIKGKKLKRDAWIIGGKLYGSRSLRMKLKCQRKEEILKNYPNAIYKPQLSKERYFYFRDSAFKNKLYKKAIEHLIKPYPKRNEQKDA